MKIRKFALIFLSITLILTSCSNDDDLTSAEPLGDYENGILISHEGNFGLGNASVSFVSSDFMTVEHDIFSAVNSRPLGDTAQSMAFDGNFAYIVLNVSNTIEIVNRYTFESVGTISTGLNNPRYITISNGKAYVSNWGDFTPTDDDYIAIIDLTTNSVTDTISSSYLPEELIAVGNKVYVATGIFGTGNLVDVINTVTDELEGSITVGNSPNSLQLDSNNDLWVLSSENLIKINTTLDQVDQTIILGDDITSNSDLNFDNGNFYMYAGGSVYKISESATSFPTSSEISGVNFYDMRVSNGFLYGLDAGDFQSEGQLKVYDLTSNTEIESISLNIIPGEVYFN